MRLCDHLDAGSVRLDLEAREKNELIADLAEPLRQHAAMEDFEAFLGGVYSREMSASTGIGGGVAIPHARTDSVGRFVAALGIVPAGVDFGSADGAPVRLVILMGIPTARVKAYLRLLAHLSLLLKQPAFVERVVGAGSAEEVLGVLAAHEA